MRAHARSRMTAHDQPTHRSVAQKSRPGARGVRRIGRMGLLGLANDTDRCDSGSLRQPGDRVHRLDGPQPPGGGRSGHLSAHGQSARAGRCSGGALPVCLRVLDDLRRLRRQRRSVLRALARAGAHEPADEDASDRRHARTRAGRDGRGPCVLVHGREPHLVVARTALDPGLVRTLSAELRARRRRGGVGRWVRAAVSGGRRPAASARVQHPAQHRCRSGSRQQHERRRQRARVERRLVDRARCRTDRIHRRCEADSDRGI